MAIYCNIDCDGMGGLAQDSKYASRIKYLSKKFGGVGGVSMVGFPSAICSKETNASVGGSRTGEEAMIPIHACAGHW